MSRALGLVVVSMLLFSCGVRDEAAGLKALQTGLEALERGEGEKALRHCARASQLLPGNTDVMRCELLAAARCGDLAAAEKAVGELLAGGAGDEALDFLSLELSKRMGRGSPVVRTVSKEAVAFACVDGGCVLPEKASWAPGMSEAGQRALLVGLAGSGRAEEALALVRSVRSAEGLWDLELLLLLKTGRMDELTRQLSEAPVQSHSAFSAVLAQWVKGEAGGSGKESPGQGLVERAILVPDAPAAQLGAAGWLMTQGRMDEARLFIDRAARLAPDEDLVIFYGFLWSSLSGRAPDARGAARHLMASVPTPWKHWLERVSASL